MAKDFRPFSWNDWKRYSFIFLVRKAWRFLQNKPEKPFFNEQLFTILRCPLSHQSLQWLPSQEIGRLQAALSIKSLCNRQGELVQGPFNLGLIRQDGKFFYLIKHDIVDLTQASAIRLFWN